MATLPLARYSCTQLALYNGAGLLKRNLNTNLADFTAFKGKYVAGFVTSIQTAIDAAQLLPNEQERTNVGEAIRAELIIVNKSVCRNWQKLKSYAEEVWTGDILKTKLEDAGILYYDNAANLNWEYTDGLNKAAKKFMTDNSAALLAAGANMPAGFPAAYNADATSWKGLYDNFLDAVDTGEGTEEKINANNDLYDLVIGVCNDGPLVYPDDAAKANKFVWASIMDIINPPGSSSANWLILDAGTNLPLEAAIVNMQMDGEPNLSQPTDAAGKTSFLSINSGTYNYRIELVNYVIATGTKEVDSGVDARKTVLLVHV